MLTSQSGEGEMDKIHFESRVGFVVIRFHFLIDSYSGFVIRTRSGFRVSCRSRRYSRDENVKLKKP